LLAQAVSICRPLKLQTLEIWVFHFNPHAGAATGTNSDETGAAGFPAFCYN
jgi:hypothetical protein